MICPNCGTNLQEGSAFCTNCGARFEAQQAQQAYQQQPYPQQPYPQQQPAAADLNAPLTTGQFFLMDLICCIPLVGLIMYFVWAFGSNANANRRSWARAKLIWVLISTVLSILLTVVLTAVFSAAGLALSDAFGAF